MLLSLCEHNVTSSNVFGLNKPLKALAGTLNPISFFFTVYFLADAAVCKESIFSASCSVVLTLSLLHFWRWGFLNPIKPKDIQYVVLDCGS